MSSLANQTASGLPLTDGHGRAALLLVESLMHQLVAGSILPLGEAVAITEIARDTQIAIREDSSTKTEDMHQAIELLGAVLATFEVDLSAAE